MDNSQDWNELERHPNDAVMLKNALAECRTKEQRQMLLKAEAFRDQANAAFSSGDKENYFELYTKTMDAYLKLSEMLGRPIITGEQNPDDDFFADV